jgi:hypothetical protein
MNVMKDRIIKIHTFRHRRVMATATTRDRLGGGVQDTKQRGPHLYSYTPHQQSKNRHTDSQTQGPIFP